MSVSSDCYAPVTSTTAIAANGNATATTIYGAGPSPNRWLTEEIFKLIDLVRSDEAIYNQRHKYYFCRPYVDSFWREVDSILEKHPGSSLAKWTNLRISFRREFTHFLQEKVPPCWAYFDRMLFLQPFLRRKKDMPHSDNGAVHDSISRISDFANNLQRQRAIAVITAHSGPGPLLRNCNNATSNSTMRNIHEQISHTQPLPFDNTNEHEQQNSLRFNGSGNEEQQPSRYPIMEPETVDASHNIKIECDDMSNDRNLVVTNNSYENEDDDDDDDDIDDVIDDHDDDDDDDSYRREYITRMSNVRRYLNQRSRLHSIDGVTITEIGTEQSQRVHNFDRSPYGQGPTSTASHSSGEQSTSELAAAAQALANAAANSANAATNSANANINSRPPPTTVATTTQQINTTPANNNIFHRIQISSSGLQTSTSAVSLQRSRANEECICITDPDAMFLMSLLPDIKKLNGRDRGKIKLAFQNILQMVLYPENNR